MSRNGRLYIDDKLMTTIDVPEGAEAQTAERYLTPETVCIQFEDETICKTQGDGNQTAIAYAVAVFIIVICVGITVGFLYKSFFGKKQKLIVEEDTSVKK